MLIGLVGMERALPQAQPRTTAKMSINLEKIWTAKKARNRETLPTTNMNGFERLVTPRPPAFSIASWNNQCKIGLDIHLIHQLCRYARVMDGYSFPTGRNVPPFGPRGGLQCGGPLPLLGAEPGVGSAADVAGDGDSGLEP